MNHFLSSGKQARHLFEVFWMWMCRTVLLRDTTVWFGCDDYRCFTLTDLRINQNNLWVIIFGINPGLIFTAFKPDVETPAVIKEAGVRFRSWTRRVFTCLNLGDVTPDTAGADEFIMEGRRVQRLVTTDGSDCSSPASTQSDNSSADVSVSHSDSQGQFLECDGRANHFRRYADDHGAEMKDYRSERSLDWTSVPHRLFLS